MNHLKMMYNRMPTQDMYPDQPSEDDDVQQDDNSRYIQMNHLKMMYNRMPTQDVYK